MCFAGTIVAKGVGIFIITQTGSDTEFGKISGMVLETEEEVTPLQVRIQRFAKFVGIFVFVVVILVFLIGIFRGYSLLQMFETSVSLAVAAIPEGMLISITVIMVLGMQRILKQNALVRRLGATETIGSVTVICTDKTGTLTLGEMRVVEIVHGEGEKVVISDEPKVSSLENDSLKELIISSILCNDAEVKIGANQNSGLVVGDPTEVALVRCAQDFKIDEYALRKLHPRIGVVPFEEMNKYMITMHDGSSQDHFLAVKGAPELILEHCTSYLKNGIAVQITQEVIKTFTEAYHDMTSRGLRVLAISKKPVQGGQLMVDALPEEMILLGIVGISDPLRHDARKMIEMARSAGIRSVIITGDHKLTARSIGLQLGYDVDKYPVIEGAMIDRWTEQEFKNNLKQIEIFARVTPAHKIKIVKAFESLGEVVAMVGDGVNDAPALKAADVGIALGSGTDVAKEVSDVVLIDNSFKTIVYAIRQGRIIFDNIRKVLIYLLSDATAETVLVLFSLVVGAPVPLTIMQILMINIIVDGLPNVALTFEKGEQGVMKRKPRPRNEDIINKTLLKVIFTVGAVMDVALIGVFIWMMKIGEPISHIRTILFLALSIGSLLYSYSCKDLYRPLWKIKLFDNHFLNYVVAGSVALLLVLVYVPTLSTFFDLDAPSVLQWLLIIVVAFIKPMTMEVVKRLFLSNKNDF
jgi:Ca2+-transporting ATPase